MPSTTRSVHKKILCTLLAFVMVVTMSIPSMPAFADEAKQSEGGVQTLTLGSSSDDATSGNEAAPTKDGEGSPVYYDGVYEGTGGGYRGDITVRVTIEDGRIAKVEEVSQGETASYWEQAKALFASIVEQQTWQVDAVSGATHSSNGIKQATQIALRKAQVDPNGAFSDGTGTESDPYIISTAQGLQNFATKVDEGENYAGKFIELGANIDLSEIENWNPIGTESNASASTATIFAGTFDGAGHTISNLKITLEEQTTALNVGLFSTLQNTAQVKNLAMANVDISVSSTALIRGGGIAGDSVGGSASAHVAIDSCSATGSVSVNVTDSAQAFAGAAIGRLSNCGTVANTWTDTMVTCFSRGDRGQNAYAGGIAGMAGNNTGIVNCATFGSNYGVSPRSTNYGGMAGGLGGMLTSKAYNNYALGASTVGNAGNGDTLWVGALAAQFIYTSGDAYPDTGAWRAFDYYPEDAVLAEETWAGDTFTSETVAPQAAGSGTSADAAFEPTAMPRAEMATDAFATTLTNNIRESLSLAAAYNLGISKLNTWVLQDGRVLPVGPTWVNTEVDPSIFDSGTGTEDDPYKIRTEEQLRAFAGSLTEGIDYTNKCVEVVADIDVSSAPWVPVGDSEYAFNGTFDGGNFTISGMHMGTAEEAMAIENGAIYVGMFSVLDANAVVKNVNLKDMYINVEHPTSFYAAGIAAAMTGGSGSSYAGAVVDSCSVQGVIKATAGRGNTFVGGIAGLQAKGAIINCATDVDASCVVQAGSAVAEVGGIVGLVNRGLVANNYSLGNVFGSASRNDGDEGMASISSIAGVNGGYVGNNYGAGGHETAEHSVYVGAVSGWVTGIGRAYSSYYNAEAPMKILDQVVNPVESIGTKVPSGVSEEGDVYTGGIVGMLEPYTAETYADIATKLNANFAEFPLDFSLFGLDGTEFKTWTYDSEAGLVTFGSEKATATYVQPQAEIVPPVELVMRDGTWYGRSADKSLVVSIVVEDNAIVGKPRVQGDYDSAAYEEALELAKEKAAYGDTSDYNAPDPTRFAGGAGTQEDPYLVSNEDQLRYISERLNVDNTWEDVHFKQTADIALSDEEWLPIGWGIYTEIKNAGKQYCLYPFLGNYDGDDFAITGLTIGSVDKPSQDPRMQYAVGFIGVGIGDAYYNATPQDGDRVMNINNVHLKDLLVNVESRYGNYVGGLAGNLQNGFYVDNCSVEGSISSASTESFGRAGGLIGNALRGSVTNCWTDADVYGFSDSGNTYVGGLYAMDNRATTVNCYVLGNVVSNAGNNNKINVGGLTGQAGGYHYNCYFAGNVTAEKTTRFAGLLNGNFAGIAVERGSYFNSDAVLTVAGAVQEPKAHGVIAFEESKDPEAFAAEGRTAEQIASQEFADLLNENVANTSENMAKIKELSGTVTDFSSMVYYEGDGSDLLSWKSEGGHAVFGEAVEDIPVDTAALNSAIKAAQDAEKGVKTSDKGGKDLSNGDKYTTAAQKKALDDAIAAAQKVLDNKEATQDQVDKAAEEVAKAKDTYKKAIKTAVIVALKSATVPSQTYTGKALKPAVTVKDANGKTVAASNYTVAYTNNINAGTATATITAKKGSGYSGTVKATFKIIKKVTWKRLAGSTAFDTMEQITKEYGKASVAIVTTNALAATGVDAGYKDALAGAALAGGFNAPMLTTSKGGLADKTRSELKRMGVKTVYIIGSTNEVTTKVDTQIKAMGITVKRINAKSASERAIAAAKQVKGRSDTVIIATQNNFKDALAISSYAYATKSPILYAETNKKLSSATVNYIKSAGFKKAIIVGGPVALPTSIEGQLKGAGIAAGSISRLAGSNQYKTARVIAEWATGKLKNGTGGGTGLYQYASIKFQPAVKLSANKLGVARADDNKIGWKDALAGAALCGKNKSVMLLADKANDGQAEAFVKANKAQINMGYVFGGTSAVPKATMTKLEKASM